VTKVTPLRSTPPFTDLVVKAVAGWRFSAAMADSVGADGKPEGPKAVPAKVLVAAHFRPPSMLTPTLGERPSNVGNASADMAYPTGTPEPPYPPQARGSGVVLVEVRVDPAGKVGDAAVVGSAGVFDAPALETARRWSFRAARLRGRPTTTYAYLLFGFAEPVATRP
jgi:TonB family protein